MTTAIVGVLNAVLNQVFIFDLGWGIALVAQAAPAMPQPRSKMNTWFSTAFNTPTMAVVITVTRGRDTPLKNPSTAHNATPSGAPSIRGHQYSSE
jgi:hypothetical protein